MPKHDRYLLVRYDQQGLQGVIFKVSWLQTEPRRERKYKSKLFAFQDYANESEAFAAAANYRNKWLDENPSIKIQKEGGDRYSLTPPSNNTSGILGVNRTFDTLKSGQKSFFWQAAWRDHSGKAKNKSFSVNRYGEDRALLMAVQARREALLDMKDELTEGEQALIDFYDDIINNIASIEPRAEKSISEIASMPKIDATEKFESIKVRIGQQRFRREVLDYFNNVCAVTKSPILLRASHIKPWARASSDERINPANGLALSPAFDAAFDSGLITFNKHGNIIISKSQSKNLKTLGITGTEKIDNLSGEHILFLAWHRDNVFIQD